MHIVVIRDLINNGSDVGIHAWKEAYVDSLKRFLLSSKVLNGSIKRIKRERVTKVYVAGDIRKSIFSYDIKLITDDRWVLFFCPFRG